MARFLFFYIFTCSYLRVASEGHLGKKMIKLFFLLLNRIILQDFLSPNVKSEYQETY